MVTGAFGFTGRYITMRLLSLGERVRTLTGHPQRPNPFGRQVEVAPFDFGNQEAMARSLHGATTLYNTYWVRFPHGSTTFDGAVENTRALIEAAKQAGVARYVHISITNASVDSSLPYFRGKGVLEEAIIGSGLSYAIIRPSVIFGTEDVLINNIAWLLRRSPVFVVFGSGGYRLQPVYVEDVANIAVDAASGKENVVIDAVGPEVYTYDALVSMIRRGVGSGARVLHMKPGLALVLSRLVGYLVKDVVVTSDEVEGLMSELLISQRPVTGHTRLSDWVTQHSTTLGLQYTSELQRHYQSEFTFSRPKPRGGAVMPRVKPRFPPGVWWHPR